MNNLLKKCRKKVSLYFLLINLKRKLKNAKLLRYKNHYPSKWLSTADLVKNDINGYLNYEGKNDDPKEILKVLYGSVKDINSQLSKYLIFFIIFNIYIVNYTFMMNLDFAVAGIKLDGRIEVLAGILIICLIMRYYLAVLSYNRKILTSSIKTILNHSIDAQLIGTYKSAYLYFENAEIYKSGNNPELIPNTKLLVIPIILFLIAFLIILLIEASIIFVYLKAFILILETSEWPPFWLWLLGLGLLGTLGASLILSWNTYLYLYYNDWTTNSKLELLEQLDVSDADKFRKEVFKNEHRIKYQIRIIKDKIKSS